MAVDDVDVPRENRDERGDDGCGAQEEEAQQTDDAGNQRPDNREGNEGAYSDEEDLEYPADDFAQRVLECTAGRAAVLMLLFDGTTYVVDGGSLAPHFELLGSGAGFGDANPQEQVNPYRRGPQR